MYPININIQSININNINIISDELKNKGFGKEKQIINNNNNNLKIPKASLEKLPKIIIKNTGSSKNKGTLFNKTSGWFGLRNGIKFNSGIFGNRESSESTSNNNNNSNNKGIINSNEGAKIRNFNNLSEKSGKISSENINLKKPQENNLCEGNNDSFIDELTDILNNVQSSKENKAEKPRSIFLENDKEKEDSLENKSDKSDNDNDDKEPDPRINFEHINKINTARPLTSYGGLNTRKKNLQRALQSAKYRDNIKNKEKKEGENDMK